MTSDNASGRLDLDGLVKLHRRSRARSETCMCGEAYPCRTLALVIEVERLRDGIHNVSQWLVAGADEGSAVDPDTVLMMLGALLDDRTETT